MTSESLTTFQCLLLQRFFDGDVNEQERQEATSLLEKSPAARHYLIALEEVSHAVRASNDEAWGKVSEPVAQEFMTRLMSRIDAENDPTLEELAPILERFYDGEIAEEERLFVLELLETREDVADYLATLDVIGSSMREVVAEHLDDQPTFENFWEIIEDAIRHESFCEEEHLVLLYRYHDGEVTPQEAALVESWLEEGEPLVVQTLQALQAIQVAVQAGVEEAQERVDFTSLWHGLENQLHNDESPSQQNSVVSLSAARDKKSKQALLQRKNFFPQSFIGFAVAAMLLITMGALLKDSLFPTEKVIIKEKTVVIVDSIEYAPGSAVMVNSPVRAASMAVEDFESDEEPTIIWLLEDNDDVLPEDNDSGWNGPI